MTTLKYIFGSKCVSLNKIFYPFEYESYNIRYLEYKVTGVIDKRLKAYCHIEIGNKIIHGPCLYHMNVDIYSGIKFSFHGLTTRQGYLTKKHKKIIREGSLSFRRIRSICPRYLPRSINVLVPANRLCNLSCVINVRVIIADYKHEGIHKTNLHCLDTPRVIRQRTWTIRQGQNTLRFI